MTARLCAGAVLLLATTGVDRADEPRYTPAVGVAMTYRTIATTKPASGDPIITGQIDTFKITSSDGVTAEGTIKPVALIIGCTDSNKEYCASAATAPGTHRDGNMLTLPVPDQIADQLAKQSQLKFHRILQEIRRSTYPHLKLASGDDSTSYVPGALFTTTILRECDDAALQAFLPFGNQAHAVIPCKQSVTQTTEPGTQLKPSDTSDTISMELSDGGPGEVTVPSGTWEIRKLSYKFLPSDKSHPSNVGETLFSTKLGANVRTHGIITYPSPKPPGDIVVELINISQ